MAKQTSPNRLPGTVVNYEHPDWSHILALVGTELTSNFIWMYEVELTDGTRLHAYKHRDTRRSVHISPDGRTFFYAWDGKSTTADDEIDYVEFPRTRAITGAFHGWARLLPRDLVQELMELVDDAWNMADAGRKFAVDPKELELQRAFEEEERGVERRRAA